MLLWKKSKTSIVNILPGVGICGTFFGIVYALWSLDTMNIRGSLPKLLDGMSIAFISSLAGLGISILLRIYLEKKAGGSGEEVTLGTVVDILKLNNEHLISLTKALTTVEDNPVVTQIQKLRIEMNDNAKELTSEFKNFAETQAENNANSLIEALEQVMRDFNTKISEQFGDNFKRLNEAVGRMLEWQENYYKQIEFITNQLDDNSKLMEKNREIITDVSEKYTDGMELSSKMESAIENLDMHRKSLETDMERFSQLTIEAEKVFPIIEDNIKGLTETLGDSIDATTENIENIISSQKDDLKELSGSLNESINNTTENIKDIVSSQTDGVKELTTSLNESIGKSTQNIENLVVSQQTQIEDNINKLNKIYEKNVNELNTMQDSIIENTRDHLQLINKGMEKALNQSLVTFGKQLTGLSEKFVDDYAPLTEKLARVLSISQGVKN